ncbi:MAG: protease, partial [Bacteroidales bacterium]|nr:protease [Bacteroidales bacterium]MDY5448188.1 protease [Prevotella sp.]
MKYVGLYTQQRRNNRMSILLLFMFPIIILFMIWVFLAVISFITSTGETDIYGNPTAGIDLASVTRTFVSTIPWVIGGVAIWFIIAYKANTAMVRAATGARP